MRSGLGAVNQAIKTIAIPLGYVPPAGLDVVCGPSSSTCRSPVTAAIACGRRSMHSELQAIVHRSPPRTHQTAIALASLLLRAS